MIASLLACSLHAQYLLEKLAEAVNTSEFDEISPIISIDGQTLYFTRIACPDFNKTLIVDGKDLSLELPPVQYERYLQDVYSQIQGKTVAYPSFSDFNQDVWVATNQNGVFDKVSHPGMPLNNALPNSICTLTPDPDAFIVINQFPMEGGMNRGFSIVRRLSDTTWSEPEPILIDDFYTRRSGITMTMSTDGSILILSLDRDDSFGETDLYLCRKLGENHWSAPKNLGDHVNSPSREATPHLSQDMKKLYFSSNRPDSYGGTDIFFTERLDDSWENWSEIRQFIPPINSTADDSQPYFNPGTGYLYFSSRRSGSSDIYRIKIAPELPPHVNVQGKIVNSKTGQPIPARLMYGSTHASDYAYHAESNDGSFQISISEGDSIAMTAEKPGYISQVYYFHFDKNRYYPLPLDVTIFMDSVVAGATIYLNPIFFERSKPVILEKSYPELRHLADILKTHKSMTILIAGHTDNLGDPADLMKLSQMRAEAVKDFLVAHDIAANRIETRGYGGNYPINSNENEESRQLNRRVEVSILKVE